MTPYGNQHRYQIDALDSSKHRPNKSSNARRSSRRLANKTQRAKTKQTLRGATS